MGPTGRARVGPQLGDMATTGGKTMERAREPAAAARLDPPVGGRGCELALLLAHFVGFFAGFFAKTKLVSALVKTLSVSQNTSSGLLLQVVCVYIYIYIYIHIYIYMKFILSE